jgi:hypothetical protein
MHEPCRQILTNLKEIRSQSWLWVAWPRDHEVRITFISSWDKRMLSLILHPEIKAKWYGPTKDGKTALILPARILAMHLYTVL